MSEDEHPPLGSRSHRRRRARSRARRSTRPRRRWRGPLLAALLSVPAGLALAAVLLLGSTTLTDGDPSAYAPDALLPDDASLPTAFFPSPEPEEGEEAAQPSAAPSPAPQAAQRLDGVETRAEESGSDEGSSSSGGGGGGGGSRGGTGGGGGSSSGGGGGSAGAMNTLSAQVFTLVNEERATAGCPPVHADDRLTAAAQLHSEDMDRNNYMSHTSLDGRSPADRARAQGYHAWSGENVAKGQRTAEQVMRDWMNSPGHRQNILNCDNRALGVGEANGAWTQMFGRE